MLFLADENFPVEITNAIGQAGRDVAWVGDLGLGIADEGVVALAVETGGTILTFQHGFSIPAGVILSRARADNPMHSSNAIVDLLTSPRDWAEYFIVVGSNRMRMSTLPKPDV
ncbi:MAG: DUF5615 family PIN-like protein [Dehalococcoidia bacterium]|nr:hypothetical protein [Chloroflexota bacterium]MCD5398196.1 DUF5615 family PIN-like protein [Dehalococcoidia bacterium]